MPKCPRLPARIASILLFGAVVPAPAPAEPSAPLVVYAAASLTETVEALAPRFRTARVEASFGASSALARQIRDGAPADVFLSASPDWIDFLREANALDGAPIVLARNELVCVTAAESDVAKRGVTDAAGLLVALGKHGLVAIADEGVPAGEYARAALKALGLLEAFMPRLVGQADVRAVLNAVEKGALDAGFVYATDARVANVRVLFAFDPTICPRIEYQAAVARGAPHPAAAHRFLEFLGGEEARKILTDAGFAVP